MKPDTLIEMLKAGNDSLNSYWSIYSVVAFALLGYAFAAERPIQLLKIRLVLAGVFLLFAVSNCHALFREQRKALAVSEYVVSQLEKGSETRLLADAMKNNPPASPWGITVFHGILDVIVIGLVLAAPTIRQSKKRN